METSLSGPCVTRGKDKRNEARRREKNATGNASDSGQECKRTGRGCDTISEIIHHSVRTNIGRHLRPDTRGSSSKRVRARMAHFFAVFLSFHFSSFLSSRHKMPNYCFYFTLSFFLSLSLSSPFSTPFRSRYRLPAIRARARCSSSPSKKSTSANTPLPGLLDSALRSERLRIMDRTNSCLQPLFSPHHSSPSSPSFPSGSYSALPPSRGSSLAGPKTSPFQSHSTLLRFSSRLSLNSVHIIQRLLSSRPGRARELFPAIRPFRDKYRARCSPSAVRTIPF